MTNGLSAFFMLREGFFLVHRFLSIFLGRQSMVKQNTVLVRNVPDVVATDPTDSNNVEMMTSP